MKFVCFVVLPLLLQIAAALAIMSMRRLGGEFVGLGIMLMGLVAVPLTALVNWLGTRAKPPLGLSTLTARTMYVTLVYPLLCLALFLFAS